MLHILSMARTAIVCNWSELENSKLWDQQWAGKLDKSDTDRSQREEQLRLIQARLGRISPLKRPHYTPCERMSILEIRSARGWNLKKTAEEFLLDEETVSGWMKQLDDGGGLIQIPQPVNKYPEALVYLIQRLKILFPRYGKKFIAELLFRVGLYLSATTVGRIIRKPSESIPPDFREPEPEEEVEIRRIISRHPDHTWLVDLTQASTWGGFWISWLPYALPPVWPFCWWIAVIIDHFSRKVIGFAVFMKQPKAEDITNMLDKAISRVGRTPKYIITDKGSQFWPSGAKPENRKNHPYLKWCDKQKIKPRHGAVGKYGSIAIIERFIKSLKTECLNRIQLPFNLADICLELSLYVTWYNLYRPHLTLKGRTPQEVYANSPSPPRIDFKPNSKLPGFRLKIGYLEGRKHLPIIELEKAA
jgi:transposase InsO family protein